MQSVICLCVDFHDSEDEDEEEDCFIMFTTSESRCDNLFDRGVDMVAQGDPAAALNLFLDTLTALQECQYTIKLLPTLFQLGDAYRVLGETEKSREISDTVSLLQEVLEDAMKEKWKKSKNSRKVKALSEQSDSGSLFLQKADACESLALDSEKNGDFEQALEHSESVFRIRQYTLGPRNPTTARSLSNLIALYNRAGETVHVTHHPDPIIFTSVIRSSCPPENQSSYTEPSPQLLTSSTPIQTSGSTQSPCSESTTQSPCSETASTQTSHTTIPPPSHTDHNVLPLDSITPECLQPSHYSTTLCGAPSQDVCTDSQPDGDMECSSECGSVSHYSFSDSANSFCTLFITFSFIAVTALSFYMYI